MRAHRRIRAVMLLLSLSAWSWPSFATVITHAEAHIFNIRITPAAGSLIWDSDPWLAISAAGAFDDPSGWQQAYDEQFDRTFAHAQTAFVTMDSQVDPRLLSIDVSGDVQQLGAGTPAITSYGQAYRTSQIVRKHIEQVFGWFKTVGGLRKTRLRGVERNRAQLLTVSAAYNLLRISRLAPLV